MDIIDVLEKGFNVVATGAVASVVSVGVIKYLERRRRDSLRQNFSINCWDVLFVRFKRMVNTYYQASVPDPPKKLRAHYEMAIMSEAMKRAMTMELPADQIKTYVQLYERLYLFGSYLNIKDTMQDFDIAMAFAKEYVLESFDNLKKLLEHSIEKKSRQDRQKLLDKYYSGKIAELKDKKLL